MQKGHCPACALLVLVIFGVVLLGAAAARGETENIVIDQQQLQEVGWYAAVDNTPHFAQTFTPGVGGFLVKVSLKLEKQLGDIFNWETGEILPVPPGDLVVEIRTTAFQTAYLDGGNSGMTTAVVPREEVLATATLAESEVLESIRAWYDVTFPVPPLLERGRPYAIVLRTTGESPGFSLDAHPGLYLWMLYGDAISKTDAYAGGSEVGRWEGAEFWSISSWPADLTFATYMDISRPVARAGSGQTTPVGTPVTLDGSGSYDPGRNYPLTYAWSVVSAPAGSGSALSDPVVPNPSFVADLPGDFVIELVVTNSLGRTSPADRLVLSTLNAAPVADAGPDRSITRLGESVRLDGSRSYDPDGDQLTYSWTIAGAPAGSQVAFDDPASATPSFVADLHGDYIFTLVVSDPWGSRSTDTIAASLANVAPVADAGSNQTVVQGETVHLDGSGSYDANLDPLGYSWNLVSSPVTSTATLFGAGQAEASFVADLPGQYILSLVVSDGFLNSEPVNVSVLAISRQDAARQKLMALIAAINGLDDGAFRNPNMRNALTGKINAILQMMEQGTYPGALEKLRHDVEGRTDGCAKAGIPDADDWINACGYQGQVYLLVLEAEGLL